MTGVLGLFTPLEGGDERIEEALQPGQDAAEKAGINFRIGQEFVTAGSKTAFHR
jgi:hypothetical protein